MKARVLALHILPLVLIAFIVGIKVQSGNEINRLKSEIQTLQEQLTSTEQQLQESKQAEIENQTREMNQGISLIELVYIVEQIDSQDKISLEQLENLVSRDCAYYKISDTDGKLVYSTQFGENIQLVLSEASGNIVEARLEDSADLERFSESLTVENINSIIDRLSE